MTTTEFDPAGARSSRTRPTTPCRRDDNASPVSAFGLSSFRAFVIDSHVRTFTASVVALESSKRATCTLDPNHEIPKVRNPEKFQGPNGLSIAFFPAGFGEKCPNRKQWRRT